MGNMSYCRFENTFADLKDCKRALERNGGIKGVEAEANEHEKPYVQRLVDLCDEIASDYKVRFTLASLTTNKKYGPQMYISHFDSYDEAYKYAIRTEFVTAFGDEQKEGLKKLKELLEQPDPYYAVREYLAEWYNKPDADTGERYEWMIN